MHLLRALHRGPRVPPRRPLRPARGRDARRVMTACSRRAERGGALVLVLGLAALAPLVVRDALPARQPDPDPPVGRGCRRAWNVAGGYAGQVSLGHSAFFGLGAYSAALLATRWNQSPWLGLLVGALLATVAGLVIGYLANRLKGPYFVLATIAFSQVLLILASRWRAVTSGLGGHPGAVPPRLRDARLRSQGPVGLPGARRWPLASTWSQRLPRALAARLPARRRCARTRTRREALGIPAAGSRSRRSRRAPRSPRCAARSGRSTSASSIRFYVFSVDLSVRFALNAIIGGLGTALGPFLGSLLITSLETYLRADVRRLRRGAHRHLPDHLRLRAHRGRALRAPGPGRLDRRSGCARWDAMPRAVTRRHQALRRPHRRTRRQPSSGAAGELLGIIGPNGAGKTTLFDVHLRLLRARRGRRCGSTARDITGLRARRRVPPGVARTFQKLQAVRQTSVLDNVMVGALTRVARRAARARGRRAGRSRPRSGLAREGERPCARRSPPGSASAWRWPARSPPGPASCCSTR